MFVCVRVCDAKNAIDVASEGPGEARERINADKVSSNKVLPNKVCLMKSRQIKFPNEVLRNKFRWPVWQTNLN